MCGIVAAISPAANIVPILLEGLRKLEYRGYQWASLAVLSGAGVERPVVASQLSADAAALANGTDVDEPKESGEAGHC